MNVVAGKSTLGLDDTVNIEITALRGFYLDM
jgi:hypothetical protein